MLITHKLTNLCTLFSRRYDTADPQSLVVHPSAIPHSHPHYLELIVPGRPALKHQLKVSENVTVKLEIILGFVSDLLARIWGRGPAVSLAELSCVGWAGLGFQGRIGSRSLRCRTPSSWSYRLKQQYYGYFSVSIFSPTKFTDPRGRSYDSLSSWTGGVLWRGCLKLK